MGAHLVSFTIQGAEGKKRALTIPVDDSSTHAELLAFALEMDGLLDAIIGGIILGCNVSLNLPVDPLLETTALDDYWVSNGGLLSFAATGTPYRSSLYVPTLNKQHIANDKSIENVGVMNNFIAALLGGANVTASDKEGNALASFLSGRAVDRK